MGRRQRDAPMLQKASRGRVAFDADREVVHA